MKTITIIVYVIMLISLCNPSHAQNHPTPLAVVQTKESQSRFTLQLKSSLTGHKHQVTSVDFSPNGRRLASGSYKEKSTRLWNTATGELVSVLEGITPLFSPDGSLLLTENGKDIKLWEAETGRLKFTLAGHTRILTAATFSPDGSRIATGSNDGTAKVWKTVDGQLVTTLLVWRVKKLPRYRIFSRALPVTLYVYVKFSPDGRRVLTNTYFEETPAKLWDAETGTLLAELVGDTTEVGFQTKTGGVWGTSFSPDGKFIVTESISRVRLWNTAGGKLVEEFEPPLSTAFSPDSKWLGLIKNEKDAGLLNLETLELQKTAGIVTNFLNQLAFSPDGKTYVIGSGYKDYHATLIDVATGRVRAKIPLKVKWGFDLISDYQKDVDLLSFHPSNEILMGASHQSVSFWDALTGRLIVEKAEARDPAKFSRNGKLLITTAKDKKTVLLWEINN